MKKNNLLAIISIFFLFLNSCGTIAEGLGASKKKSSDEFLVEKKAPLVLPPSFGELPKPRIKKNEDLAIIKENTTDIEKIIGKSTSKSSSVKKNESNSLLEKSIIEKINAK
jgi:hypothetical protein